MALLLASAFQMYYRWFHPDQENRSCRGRFLPREAVALPFFGCHYEHLLLVGRIVGVHLPGLPMAVVIIEEVLILLFKNDSSLSNSSNSHIVVCMRVWITLQASGAFDRACVAESTVGEDGIARRRPCGRFPLQADRKKGVPYTRYSSDSSPFGCTGGIPTSIL